MFCTVPYISVYLSFLAYLLHPFCSQVVWLLAFDPQSGYRQHHVALLKRLCPLQRRVDDLGLNASDLCKNRREVCPVDVDGVDVWEAIGVL